jgi:hypothetical protein
MAAGRVVLYSFLMSNEITRADHRVEFTAKIGRLDCLPGEHPCQYTFCCPFGCSFPSVPSRRLKPTSKGAPLFYNALTATSSVVERRSLPTAISLALTEGFLLDETTQLAESQWF